MEMSGFSAADVYTSRDDRHKEIWATSGKDFSPRENDCHMAALVLSGPVNKLCPLLDISYTI